MGFQPEYGERLVRTRIVETTPIPYYRFITRGSEAEKVELAGVGDPVIAVSLESEEWGRDDGAGGTVAREGWEVGDMPEAQATGIAFIELGATVLPGAKAVSDSVGRGVTGTFSTTILATEMEAVGGIFLEGGDIGDIVRIDLDRRA